MSLSTALGSATSSLRAIQVRLALASSNIANADNSSYTTKRAKLAPSVTGGVGTGVEVTGVGSGVNANLLRDIVNSTSENAAAQAFYNFMKALSDTLGHVNSDGSGSSIASRLSKFQSRLDSLATTPESATLKGEVITSLDDAVTSMRNASEEVQHQRAQADAAIAKAVGAANDALRDIHTLNESILRAGATSQPTADLEDLRSAALKSLGEQIKINGYISANGAMTVYSGSGEILVGTEVHELTFTAAAKVSESAAYPTDLSGVRVNGHDITGSLASGKISALLTLRDVALPGIQSRLDAAAGKLKDSINTLSNGGSAAPPPNTLTGTSSHNTADALSASGSLRVAVTDAQGAVTETQDLPLSSYSTVGDLIGALNGIPGLSASLDGDGHLSLRATITSNGVAVAGGSVNGKSLSGYFGLNDLVVGSGAGDLAVKVDVLADSTRLPTGLIPTSGTLSTGKTAISTGSSKLATAMADDLRASGVIAMVSDLIGDIGARTNSAKSRAATAETSLNALTSRFSSQYGVNVNEENARILQLQNAYAASSQVLSAVKSMFDDLMKAVR
ncbi:flagellar hook-associated protein FlgK [Shumkonia mesophila]|uniref:flagellar hook-associated protein FlgK n=1 Tax=Shumkonia mesophila TaxID=2838854 RepID=UPI002934374A|nr:flagellar hook-associated protein FlgK [Shumkonia mesophila]